MLLLYRQSDESRGKPGDGASNRILGSWQPEPDETLRAFLGKSERSRRRPR
jgi:hypothetical protein